MSNWNLPKDSEPGFLRRRRELTEILDLIPTPANTAKLTEYLDQYVDGKAEELSKEEYNNVVLVLLGLKSSVSDPKEESSELQ